MTPVHFLDPGIGTGSFYSALRSCVSKTRIKRATGFEIDPHYGDPAKRFWASEPLDIRMEDFTDATPQEKEKANLLICNPPYVRHHHIGGEKGPLQLRAEQACGVRINGLSGLYCYFMGLSHPWMEPDAVAGWLIPSEFMGVNYGRQLKEYLLKKVTLLQIHRFDPADVQFTDALVSSAVVWLRNSPPPKNHQVLFTFGGGLSKPALSREIAVTDLLDEPKWTRYPQAEKASVRAQVTLGDLFDIKRGLATGDNSFFIMTEEEIGERQLPMELFRPVLPGSRHIPNDEIEADERGWPQLERQLFLLDTVINEDELAQRYPTLKNYLDTGKGGGKPVADRYLCRTRRPWYAQEKRPAAPIICTYMGRRRKGGKPFRFFLNHSEATACNTYLMLYPKPALAALFELEPESKREVWQFLNDLDPDDLIGHGRVYGGGLHKLEPKELRSYPAQRLIDSLPGLEMQRQQSLFEEKVA